MKLMQSVLQTDLCELTPHGRASSHVFNKILEEAAGRAGELPMMIHLQHWGIHLRAALGHTVVPSSMYLYVNIKARC